MRAWAGLMLAKKQWEKAKELLIEEVEWLREFGVEFSAGVEMELALYRGRLEEGLGREGCQEYRRAGGGGGRKLGPRIAGRCRGRKSYWGVCCEGVEWNRKRGARLPFGDG